MSDRTIRWVLKPLVFLVCLLPLMKLVHRGILQDLGADPIATITHATGFWALYLLLASLAITPVRRLSRKLGWMIRFRRMLGLFAFFYATLHLLTYVLLFSGFDLQGAWAALGQHQFGVVVEDFKAVWPTMRDDMAKRRFVQVGLLAWFILLLLAATSPAWVMRKMGGKPWQTLHRTVYAAAVLAVLHYWWLVKSGVLEPWKVSAVLAVLLGARVWWQWKARRARAVR